MRLRLGTFSRYRPRVLTLVVLVVVAALIVLANLTYDQARFRCHQGDFSHKSYGWPLVWHRYVAEMESKLKLTTAQVKQLEAIMDDTKAKYKAVRDSYKPAILQVKNQHVQEVKSILTAQQIPAYEKLLSEREQRAREQDERERRDEQRRAAQHKTQAEK